MNKCTELDIQEMLPDLLHGKLDARESARVEAHVASCDECSEDLEVLRTVKSAAVFVPAIDVERVVRQIPPYREIVPAAEVPARSRVVSWLVAASFAVVVLGGGSLLMIQQRPSGPSFAAANQPARTGSTLSPAASGVAVSAKVAATAASTEPRTHALAMASGVDGLSDTNLRQFMTDMDTFDALPATEPEPVLSVDNGDSLEQGSR